MERSVIAVCLAFCSVTGRAEPVIIEGGPRLSYEDGRGSQQMAPLWSALQAMGCPVSYEELMVASGNAFQFGWLPGAYDYAAIDLTPQDHFRTATEAIGARIEWRSHTYDAAAYATISASLDEGRPCLTWRGWTLGARVILGHDPDTWELYMRDFAKATPEYDTMEFSVPTAPPPLKRPPQEVLLLWCDPGAPLPELDLPLILERAVMYADWPLDNKLCGQHLFGLAAYDAWAETLRAGPDAAGTPTDVQITLYAVRTLVDSRQAAARFFQDYAAVHEAFPVAAEHYAAEVNRLRAVYTAFERGAPGDWMAMVKAMEAALEDPAGREEMAALIEAVKAEEVQAVDALREALADLGAP
ncbi:MAG: hypothetical protein FJX74_16780 [Armatimonadetes bacterium]|nr:hypothetical protein [Armatimonadota bacterium]